MMPWRLPDAPLRSEARVGAARGVVWNAFRNCAPSCARRSMLGVFMYGCPDALVSSKRRSSMRMTRRFGFLALSLRLVAELVRALFPALDNGAEPGGDIGRLAAHRLERRLRQALSDLGKH